MSSWGQPGGLSRGGGVWETEAESLSSHMLGACQVPAAVELCEEPGERRPPAQMSTLSGLTASRRGRTVKLVSGHVRVTCAEMGRGRMSCRI